MVFYLSKIKQVHQDNHLKLIPLLFNSHDSLRCTIPSGVRALLHSDSPVGLYRNLMFDLSNIKEGLESLLPQAGVVL